MARTCPASPGLTMPAQVSAVALAGPTSPVAGLADRGSIRSCFGGVGSQPTGAAAASNMTDAVRPVVFPHFDNRRGIRRDQQR